MSQQFRILSLAGNNGCLKHFRARINAYLGTRLAQSLIALSSPDPLAAASEMSARLENLAQYQSFATKLMDCIQTSKELEIFRLSFGGNLCKEPQDNDDDSDSVIIIGLAIQLFMIKTRIGVGQSIVSQKGETCLGHPVETRDVLCPSQQTETTGNNVVRKHARL